MKIAYIGHSHHARTGSNAFFLDMLREVASVDVYFDHGWLGKENIDLDEILARDYNVIVLFQVERYAKPLNDSDARVIFVPMYDSCLPFADDFWKELTRIEILCFCRALYERLDGWGLRARYAQFFPNTACFAVNSTPEHAGFFWNRREEPSWQTVKALLGKSRLGWINVHRVRDPSVTSPVLITDNDQARYRLRFTEWSENKVDYMHALQQAGIFFAPRLEEGIGMAFLEAMAMGKAVVAADNPTMNEYITHQVNGYLFDPYNPMSLDLSRFREVGCAGRQSMERGNRRWQQSKRDIQVWFATGVWPHRRPAYPRRSGSAATISAIVLPTGDEEAAEQTRLSIDAQSHAPLEQIAASAHRAVCKADLVNHAAATAKGEWLIFLHAGTMFLDENVVGEALENAEADADFVTCHYLELCDERELMRRVADFDWAVERFSSNRLDSSWFASLPILAATLIKRRVFERARFAPPFRLAADIDFFLRAKRMGAIFRHGNTALSRIRGYDVEEALGRIKECRSIFLNETPNHQSVDALCSSLDQEKCDPLLDRWARLGTLRLGLKLMRHRSVARYARDRAWRRLQFLGIRGILLRQLLWLRARTGASGRSTLH